MRLLIFLFLLSSISYGQSIDHDYLDGYWYNCSFNGEYEEMRFDGRNFAYQYRQPSMLKGSFQISSHTLKLQTENELYLLYVLAITEKEENSFSANVFDQFQMKKKTFNKLKGSLKGVGFLERKTAIGCLDKRTSEQKIKDSIQFLETEKKLIELTKRIDSLGEINRHPNNN